MHLSLVVQAKLASCLYSDIGNHLTMATIKMMCIDSFFCNKIRVNENTCIANERFLPLTKFTWWTIMLRSGSAFPNKGKKSHKRFNLDTSVSSEVPASLPYHLPQCHSDTYKHRVSTTYCIKDEGLLSQTCVSTINGFSSGLWTSKVLWLGKYGFVTKPMLHYLKSSIDVCSSRLSRLILKPSVAGDGSLYKASTSKMSKSSSSMSAV